MTLQKLLQDDRLNKPPGCLKVMCLLTEDMTFGPRTAATSARLDQQIVVVEFMRRKLAFVFKELQVGGFFQIENHMYFNCTVIFYY